MPRIQQILANSPGVGVSPVPRIGGDTFASSPIVIGQPGANLDAVRRAGLSVADSAGRALETIQRAEEEKRRLQIRTDAAEVQAQVELELANAAAALQTERDPDAYQAKLAEAATAIQQSLPKRVKYQETLAELGPRLPGIFGTASAAAYKHGNTLYVEGREASLARTLDAKTRLAGQTGLDDDAGFVQHYRDAVGAIAALEPLKGSKWVAEQTIKLREGMLAERARRHADADPDGFVEALDTRYQGLDPVKRNELVAHAEAVRQKRNQERRTADEAARQQWERERQAMLSDLEDAALKGTLDPVEVDARRELRQLDHADVSRLTRMQRERAVGGGPGTPDVIRGFAKEVYATSDPQATLRRLELAFEARDVPLDRYQPWAALLRGQIAKVTDRGRSEDDRFQERRHQRTADLIQRTLKTQPTLSVQLDYATEEVIAQAMEDYGRNSTFYGGKEDPEAWWERRKAFYIARVQDRATQRIKEIGRQLTYTDVRTLHANRAQFRTEADFWDQVRLFKERDDLTQEIERMKARGNVRGGGQPAEPRANPLGR